MKKQLAGVIRLNAKQKVWNDNDVVQKLYSNFDFRFLYARYCLFKILL